MPVKYAVSRMATVMHDMPDLGLLAIVPWIFDYETDKYFMTGNRRQYKQVNFFWYFDTWEEAHTRLKARAADQLACARESLDSAERTIKLVEAMTMPQYMKKTYHD